MHKTLEQQVNQFLSQDGQFPSGWDEFIKAVNETYTHFDEEKMSMEHTLASHSQELTQKNQILEDSLKSAQEFEEKLQIEKASFEKKVEERTREFKEEQTRLNAAINSLTRGLIMTDADHNILNTNSAARLILRLAKEDVSIETIQERLKDQFNFIFELKKCLITRQMIDSKVILIGKQYIQISMTPIISDQYDALGVIILMEDITEAKTLERSKDEFFSIASHELRTPLTAIRGNTYLIKQYYFDKLQDQDLKGMIDDIHESSIRLISIVNDFLDTSRLEIGKMQFKKDAFDLVPLVSDVVKEYLATGSLKNLYLKLNEPTVTIPQVIGDKERVKQVLINLIGNSLKFTQEGGVTIFLDIIPGQVRTYVQDTGKGIPAENQSLLFRKFQQAGSSLYTRDDVQGTGLGLYISKMMMEGMGGTIELASSEVGKGTTFVFSLPIKK